MNQISNIPRKSPYRRKILAERIADIIRLIIHLAYSQSFLGILLLATSIFIIFVSTHFGSDIDYSFLLLTIPIGVNLVFNKEEMKGEAEDDRN